MGAYQAGFGMVIILAQPAAPEKKSLLAAQTRSGHRNQAIVRYFRTPKQ
jgi:hypothetical protein